MKKDTKDELNFLPSLTERYTSWVHFTKGGSCGMWTQQKLITAVSGILNEWGYYHFSGSVSERFEGDNTPTLMFALEHPANAARIKPVGKILSQLVHDHCPIGTRIWFDQGVFYVSPA